MGSYDDLRQQYCPEQIKFLLIAESPPPSAEAQGSRHFYRTDKVRRDDRLFMNTIWALYPETEGLEVEDLQKSKEQWLRRLQSDGWYMIEALEVSQRHTVKKPERQVKIKEALPRLIERVRGLADQDTKIILIKSNVFQIAAEPLKEAGFNVLNTELVDYPGRFNQRAYRAKLARLGNS
jgi:hypothetical protein